MFSTRRWCLGLLIAAGLCGCAQAADLIDAPEGGDFISSGGFFSQPTGGLTVSGGFSVGGGGFANSGGSPVQTGGGQSSGGNTAQTGGLPSTGGRSSTGGLPSTGGRGGEGGSTSGGTPTPSCNPQACQGSNSCPTGSLPCCTPSNQCGCDYSWVGILCG